MEKKYGFYPGVYASIKEYIESCSEMELFLLIREKTKHIRFLRDDLDDAEKEYCDIKEEYYALDFAIMQTKRFGVLIENPIGTERLKIAESFLKWYSKKSNEVDRNPLGVAEVEKAIQTIKRLALK